MAGQSAAGGSIFRNCPTPVLVFFVFFFGKSRNLWERIGFFYSFTILFYSMDIIGICEMKPPPPTYLYIYLFYSKYLTEKGEQLGHVFLQYIYYRLIDFTNSKLIFKWVLLQGIA